VRPDHGKTTITPAHTTWQPAEPLLVVPPSDGPALAIHLFWVWKVNPLVEGSSPSPVTEDRTRHKAAGCVQTAFFAEPNESSPQVHSILSSRQDATETDPIRPPRATRGATRDYVVPDSDLADVVDAWAGPPDAIRAGIVAMVKAASK
jgi:hypothetical protein